MSDRVSRNQSGTNMPPSAHVSKSILRPPATCSSVFGNKSIHPESSIRLAPLNESEMRKFKGLHTCRHSDPRLCDCCLVELHSAKSEHAAAYSGVKDTKPGSPWETGEGGGAGRLPPEYWRGGAVGLRDEDIPLLRKKRRRIPTRFEVWLANQITRNCVYTFICFIVVIIILAFIGQAVFEYINAPTTTTTTVSRPSSTRRRKTTTTTTTSTTTTTTTTTQTTTTRRTKSTLSTTKSWIRRTSRTTTTPTTTTLKVITTTTTTQRGLPASYWIKPVVLDMPYPCVECHITCTSEGRTVCFCALLWILKRYPHNNEWLGVHAWGNCLGQDFFNFKPPSADDCYHTFSPVCAIDGRTYWNECFLYNTTRNDGFPNKIEHEGICQVDMGNEPGVRDTVVTNRSWFIGIQIPKEITALVVEWSTE